MVMRSQWKSIPTTHEAAADLIEQFSALGQFEGV